MDHITVIGGGLAGCEAAWQIANKGIKVKLFEMRPKKNTPAHQTDYFAELVCSNSLRAANIENAVGLLKEEMKLLNSLVMEKALIHRVPAGGALAVDRERFAQDITKEIKTHPNIEVIVDEVERLPINDRGITVVATGPLTSPSLSLDIQKFIGEDYYHFFDAAAPIVTKESINFDIVFRASRYGKGDDDYLNCPMTEEEYNVFYDALISGQLHELKEFEKQVYFEGCMPVEVMAKRGKQTLLFGPLKPVGLVDPRTGKQPFAVVQLRQDNKEATLFNIVGFQTSLKWGDQKKVIQLIPGLENAEIIRYGVIHKNSYISSPKVLLPTLQSRNNANIFFAGQLTGVEGYVESASNGIVAGINAAKLYKGQETIVFPIETGIGALIEYITTCPTKNFQPMNVNFGLFPAIEKKIKDKKLKNLTIAQRSLTRLGEFIEKNLQ